MKTMKIILILVVIPFLCARAQSTGSGTKTDPLSDSFELSDTTEKIAGKLSNPVFLSCQLEEEPYVCDIPFNTKLIASDVKIRNIISCKEEEQVEDIPFKTEEIYFKCLLLEYVTAWENENNVEDFPYDTYFLVHCNGKVMKHSLSCITVLKVVRYSILAQESLFKEILDQAEGYLAGEEEHADNQNEWLMAMKNGPNEELMIPYSLVKVGNEQYMIRHLKSLLDNVEFLDEVIARIVKLSSVTVK